MEDVSSKSIIGNGGVLHRHSELETSMAGVNISPKQHFENSSPVAC